MKTFKLDQDGDVVIVDNQIQLVEGIELVAQTLRQVLGTNLGEWFGDSEEGIDFYVILTKNPNYDLVRDTIETAVQKTAESLEVELETDNFTFDLNGRNLTIAFTLTMNGAESADIEVTL
jgi:hypothetical protein